MQSINKKNIVFLIITLICLVGCQKQEKTVIGEKEIPVEVLEAKISSYDKKIMVPGVITSDEEIIYSFQMEGKITEILVEAGQTVKKGEVLARLEEKDYNKLLEISQLQVKAAKAEYDNARNTLVKAKENYEQEQKNFERVEVLFEEGAISKSEYESAELVFKVAKENYNTSREGTVELAKSNYDQAVTNYHIKEDQFANGELRSSFNGYVKAVYGKEGNQIEKNEPIIAIGSANGQVIIGLSAEEKQNIKIGDEVTILYGSKSMEGQIQSISDVLDSNTLLYKIKISIPENDIPAYSIIKVEVKVGEQGGVKIPIQAVLNDGVSFVFIAEDDHAVKRKVDIIGYDQQYVFIEGVFNQEKIITVGNKVLRGGERVMTNEM